MGEESTLVARASPFHRRQCDDGAARSLERTSLPCLFPVSTGIYREFRRETAESGSNCLINPAEMRALETFSRIDLIGNSFHS